jgi:hypothetical protein
MKLQLLALGVASAMALSAASANAATTINAGTLNLTGFDYINKTVSAGTVKKPVTTIYDVTFTIPKATTFIVEASASASPTLTAYVELLSGNNVVAGSMEYLSNGSLGYDTPQFKLGAGSYTLVFDAVNSGKASPAKFGLGVTAVPEPATWAMMLFGIGGIGATLRISRQKKTGIVAAA